tara:strand:+ start:466 stop:1185 length:720 start_codon:yes stop_codon:yes gene_type:complete
MWFNILKDKWAMFTENILKDKWPTNRKKYVKFSNLDDINQRMVKFYLEKGKHKPQHRKVYVKQILIEMEKSSNARFDLEKFDIPGGFKNYQAEREGWVIWKRPDRVTQQSHGLLHRELSVYLDAHFIGSLKKRGGKGKHGDIKSFITKVRSLGLPNGEYYARANPNHTQAVIFSITSEKGAPLPFITLFGYQCPYGCAETQKPKRGSNVIDLWNQGEDDFWMKKIKSMLDSKDYTGRDL